MLQLRSKETWSLATTRSPSLSFQTKGAEAAVCAMVVGRDHEVVACFQPARSPSWSVSLCLGRNIAVPRCRHVWCPRRGTARVRTT